MVCALSFVVPPPRLSSVCELSCGHTELLHLHITLPLLHERRNVTQCYRLQRLLSSGVMGQQIQRDQVIVTMPMNGWA